MNTRTLVTLSVLSLAAFAGESENPPEGPPWRRDLAEARKEALEKGLPLFVYFTKTY